jgi:IS5 family transposase
MALSKRQIAYLNKIISTAQKFLATAEQEEKKAAKSGTRRRRRSGAEAEKMRADILAKRAKGVPAAKLAEKYGVSTAYIYMIKD